MVTGAIPLLPVSTTKVGPGEKERAYVVRQNVVLKTLLIAFSIMSGLGTLLCCTVYEVHVQRRTSIESKREQREESHSSHLRVMRLSMVLQQRLKDEVHDMGVLTTYRAWLLRAVGEYQGKIAERCNCSEAGSLSALGAEFDKQVDGLLKRLWDDLVSEGRAAQAHLHNITAAIMSELKQDASEAAQFEALMHAAGEHVHPNEDEYGADDGDSSLGIALEAFHEKLLREDSVLRLDAATLEQWQEQYESSMRTLGDENKEADMVRIDERIVELLSAAHVPAFNASTHASELDYFTDLMYRAKLAPYRDELLLLLRRWQEGDTPLSEPLNRVEELIDMNVLQPDVLLVSSDNYESYKYEDQYD